MSTFLLCTHVALHSSCVAIVSSQPPLSIQLRLASPCHQTTHPRVQLLITNKHVSQRFTEHVQKQCGADVLQQLAASLPWAAPRLPVAAALAAPSALRPPPTACACSGWAQSGRGPPLEGSRWGPAHRARQAWCVGVNAPARRQTHRGSSTNAAAVQTMQARGGGKAATAHQHSAPSPRMHTGTHSQCGQHTPTRLGVQHRVGGMQDAGPGTLGGVHRPLDRALLRAQRSRRVGGGTGHRGSLGGRNACRSNVLPSTEAKTRCNGRP